jgi:hypothetical protein
MEEAEPFSLAAQVRMVQLCSYVSLILYEAGASIALMYHSLRIQGWSRGTDRAVFKKEKAECNATECFLC